MPELILKASEVAHLVQGQVRGDAEMTVSGVADLKSARSEHISFLGNSRYVSHAKESKAGIILVAPSSADHCAGTLVLVENPSAAFAQVVAFFAPKPITFPPGIHPTAVVALDAELEEGVSLQAHVVIEPGVKIGANTVVGAGSYIGHGSILGADTWIYPNVTVRERSQIGNRVIIHSGSVIGSDGFGYEFQKGRHEKIPQIGFVRIDDDVEIGANVAIDRGRFDRTWIQQGAKIDNLVQIAHNVVIGAHSIIVAQAGISGSTTLGKYVTMAGQSGLAGHLKVGDQAVITAQAGVAKDVPAQAVIAGRHAKPLRESLKIEALTNRLPELFERLRALEEKSKSQES